jgi:hypothetical protein
MNGQAMCLRPPLIFIVRITFCQKECMLKVCENTVLRKIFVASVGANSTVRVFVLCTPH